MTLLQRVCQHTKVPNVRRKLYIKALKGVYLAWFEILFCSTAANVHIPHNLLKLCACDDTFGRGKPGYPNRCNLIPTTAQYAITHSFAHKHDVIAHVIGIASCSSDEMYRVNMDEMNSQTIYSQQP